MSRLLPAQVGPAGDHLLVDVLVADLGPDEPEAVLLEGPFEAHVAHGRGHDFARPEPPRFFHVEGLDEQGVVAAEQAAVPVHPQGPVGVPVVGDADRRPRLADARGQPLGVEGAATGVDVRAVGRRVERLDLEAEPGEQSRGDRRAGAVGAVDDDPEAGRGPRQPDAAHEVIDIVAGQLVVEPDLRLVAGQPAAPFEDGGLHFELPLVGDLDPLGREDLDAVVTEGIVGGGDDRPGRKAVRLRQVGDGRGRDDAGRYDIAAGRAHAAGKGALHPRPGFAGVAADEDPRTQSLALQELDQGRAEPGDGRRVERERPGHGPHAVGAEELLLGAHFFLTAAFRAAALSGSRWIVTRALVCMETSRSSGRGRMISASNTVDSARPEMSTGAVVAASSALTRLSGPRTTALAGSISVRATRKPGAGRPRSVGVDVDRGLGRPLHLDGHLAGRDLDDLGARRDGDHRSVQRVLLLEDGGPVEVDPGDEARRPDLVEEAVGGPQRDVDRRRRPLDDLQPGRDVARLERDGQGFFRELLLGRDEEEPDSEGQAQRDEFQLPVADEQAPDVVSHRSFR